MEYDWIIDGGYLPQSIIRMGIRRQLAQRKAEIKKSSRESAHEAKMDFISQLRTQEIAIETDTANEQHYEVSTGLMANFLGPKMKYSCCLYSHPSTSLEQAEIEMLEQYINRANIKDGMNILDMGCGWGSASFYIAERFPNAKVTSLSNSKTQKVYIDSQARRKGLSNLTSVTTDVVNYEFTESSFDRIIAIESFEHMKNYQLLMSKLASSLKPGGKLFVHIFAHKDTPYHFEGGWMSRYFFTGGTMASADLLLYFQDDLRLQNQWWISGNHYARTCEDWLARMNRNRKGLWPHLVETYGEKNASSWYYRWQVFFMACAELFASDGGDTWGICQYLFEKPAA
ncbi:cyclopropane-fatty-acyl-phospholipid synthase-like protein [Aspergillus ambiguus]|uniref:SAM-dependent methyltransferase n=1 Tax=Aspergillus ambiguus TaxID=176160 RepID=UPI003CCCE620